MLLLLYSDWSTSYLIRALTTYHSHVLVLLNHVGIVVKLISTLVNKSLYHYYIIIVPMILRPHVYSSHSMCSNKKLEVSTCDQLSQNIRSSSSQKLRLLLTLQTEV